MFATSVLTNIDSGPTDPPDYPLFGSLEARIGLSIYMLSPGNCREFMRYRHRRRVSRRTTPPSFRPVTPTPETALRSMGRSTTPTATGWRPAKPTSGTGRWKTRLDMISWGMCFQMIWFGQGRIPMGRVVVLPPRTGVILRQILLRLLAVLGRRMAFGFSLAQINPPEAPPTSTASVP